MRALKDFGMSDNEVEVYLALLKTGSVTANKIATITGMKRSTTYDNLALLTNKGIVSSFIKDNVHYYKAADPDALVKIIDERKAQMQKIIPELRQLQQVSAEESEVSYFEGRKGVFTVLDMLYSGHYRKLLFYGSKKQSRKTILHYPDSLTRRRTEHNIHTRGILAEEDRDDPVMKEQAVKKLSEMKYLKELDQSPGVVFIVPDKVAFLGVREPVFGLIVKNKDIVEHQTRILEFLWKHAKR